tara:strand:+ start:122420 stop:123520 length:1101 start_codon:yes stop_codon:yes gene_type:complete
MIHKLVLILSAYVVSSAYSQSTQVVRWSVDGRHEAEIVSAGEQGVTLKLGNDDLPTIIPWYDLRELTNNQVITSDWKKINLDAWRAHARLNRGDYSGAARLYQQLAQNYLWKVGPESADVAVGLSRTTLDRGDRVGAVLPFLGWSVALGTSNFEESSPVDGIDIQYGVLVDLPPIFVGDDFDTQLEPMPNGQTVSLRAKILHAIYKLAHDADSRTDEQLRDDLVSINSLVQQQGRRDPGVVFIVEMLNAVHHPDLQKRNASRAALKRRVRTNPDSWIEVWARLGIGASLISEKDTKSNELGAIELIHIVVRLAHESPALALLSSQMVNEYLIKTNREQWGQSIMLQVKENSMNSAVINEKESKVHE